jgi:hypothetical protein
LTGDDDKHHRILTRAGSDHLCTLTVT